MSICLHEQLISRNRLELSEVIATFLDLNGTYRSQFSLYLDQNTWELFDTRTGRSIIRHEFKHFNRFTQDMKRLNRSFLDAFSAYSRLARSKKPTGQEIWSIKFLLKYYPIHDEDIFHPLIKKYLDYGNLKKTNID